MAEITDVNTSEMELFNEINQLNETISFPNDGNEKSNKYDDLDKLLEEYLSGYTDHDYNYDPYDVLFFDKNNDHGAYEKQYDHEEILSNTNPNPNSNSNPNPNE